ncbi:MAG: transposase [Bacteroidota bacterium]|jgi:transposase-like protein
MTRQTKLTVRYSISFKQKVVREIEEEGLSIGFVRRRYGIGGGSTLQQWIKQFGKNHLLNKIVRVEMKGEKDRIKEMEAEIKKLKMALADATMEKYAMETLLKVAGEHYGEDIKKNLGPQALKESAKKKGSR